MFSVAAAPAPRLEVPIATYNFGWRDAEETVTNCFVLRNTGDADLHLTDIRTSCGCTQAKPSDRVIAPGRETVLEVHLALRGLQGRQRKSVSVLSNDPEVPSITLWMQGEARAAFCLEPPAYSFGRIHPKEPPAPATIRLGGYAATVTVTRAVSDNPSFPVSVNPDGRSLTLGPPALTAPGAHRAKVAVTLSSAEKGELSLPVYAWLEDLLRIHPSVLSFHSGAAADSPLPRIVIVRRGTAPVFHVTGVRVAGAAGKASFQMRPDGSVHIRVDHVEAATAGPDAALVIATDLPDHPEWRVPIRTQ